MSRKLTFCRKGLHEMTPENTVVWGGGRRRCRICARMAANAWTKANRELRRDADQRYRDTHREHVRALSRETSRRYRQAHAKAATA